MLKNYTSGKNVKNPNFTFDKIQKILIDHNAKSINYEYKNGKISGLIFVLEINGKDFGFRLPARVESVEALFYKHKKPRYSWQKADPLTKEEKEQAYRTAWANIRDWIDAQMALIDTEMVKVEEVFLPYLVNRTGKTLFESMENNQFLLPEIDNESEG